MTAQINILLVDDEQRNLDALEAILCEPGYSLLRATDADKALKLLLEHDVAAIVLDIKMPGVSGFELAQMIKGSKRFREIPILFLTAYMVDDGDVMTGYGAGAVDYLTKPVKSQILRHKIEVFAELFRKTRALAELNATLELRVQERTAELEKSEAALRAASAQKDAFIATLAHELRNPLAPIRVGLDLLVQLPDPSPVALHTITAMDRQLGHMVRLIDDLLDVSRVSRGVLELKREPTDLLSVVMGAVELVKPHTDQRQQTVEVATEVTSQVLVDPTRLVQIISNLLHNASKYTSAGGNVRVEVHRDGDRIHVHVVDHGAGIPANQLDRVFEMFARIERSVPNANGGLGIGLALSRHLAALHGGELTAASEGEGAGATFTLSLPRVEVDDPDAAPPEASAATPTCPRHKIVVIEDNEDSGDLLALWLETMGHEVSLARCGLEGVALVAAAAPRIVLCDMGLPDIDGAEVCRRVLELGLGSQPVMVALTGWGTEADRKKTGDVGFVHHLVKPVALTALREILSSVARVAPA